MLKPSLITTDVFAVVLLRMYSSICCFIHLFLIMMAFNARGFLQWCTLFIKSIIWVKLFWWPVLLILFKSVNMALYHCIYVNNWNFILVPIPIYILCSLLSTVEVLINYIKSSPDWVLIKKCSKILFLKRNPSRNIPETIGF